MQFLIDIYIELENMIEEKTTAFDEILYPNYLHPLTHPDRLATMTRFFGVNPKPAGACRVLELGCGTGTSLLSFAFDLPDSEFIGIDLSEKQIEIGRNAVKAVGLKNLSLLQGDIMEISREQHGEFDYIIAHGLYSWMSGSVRDRLLKICREMLVPQGVAFISYNTLPGGHFLQIARQMMHFNTKKIASPIERVKQSVGFLGFIGDSAVTGKLYKKILQEEFERLSARSFEDIFHDDLFEVNHPVYFHEFVEHAKKHDLQFVTEIEYFPTQNGNYDKDVIEILEEISDDVIAFEQYLDFINGRLFRNTLLCHGEININHLPDANILREVRISSHLQPASEKPELATGKHEIFVGKHGEKIEINHPLTKAALFHLGQIWKDSATFEELINAAHKLLSAESNTDFEITEQMETELAEMILRIFSPEFLRFHSHDPVYAVKVSEKPLASPVAQWQSKHSDKVSTLLCTDFVIRDELGKELLRLLDGTRDRTRIASDLIEFINSEKFERPADVKRNIIRSLSAQLEKSLTVFAEKALLVS